MISCCKCPQGAGWPEEITDEGFEEQDENDFWCGEHRLILPTSGELSGEILDLLLKSDDDLFLVGGSKAWANIYMTARYKTKIYNTVLAFPSMMLA